MAAATATTAAAAVSGKFTPGFQPEQIALKFADGKPVHSQYDGDRVMFTLVDGRKWFADLYIAQKIEQMRIQPGELFEVAKVEKRRGNQKLTEIEINLIVEPAAAAVPFSGGVPAAGRGTHSTQDNNSVRQGRRAADDSNGSPSIPLNGNGESSADYLARCYRDAVDVCLATLAYAKAKGLVLAPNFGDVRALAATICISETGRRS
jgi:hypothetical protein